MKRKNGEGSVYKMKNGKYRASVMIGYRSDGKPICKEFKRSTRKEAERALRDFISDKNKKISFGKTATVNELANEWLYNVKKYEVRPTSFDRLESTYKTHIEKEFGFMQASAVTARDVQKLMNKCSKRLTYNSATKVYKLLSALFDWNITSPDYETRIRTDNPCAGVKLRRENCVASRKNVKYFSDEEIESSLEAMKKENPRLGDKIVRGGQRVSIPVRQPLGVLVADGYAAIGDSAFMTVPVIGSGIANSLKAAKILADAVKADKDGAFSMESLWKYQTEFYKKLGSGLAGLACVKLLLTKLKGSELDYMFETGVLTADDLTIGADATSLVSMLSGVSVSDIINKVKNVVKDKELLKKILKTGERMAAVSAVVAAMPKKPTASSVSRWAKRYENCFKIN